MAPLQGFRSGAADGRDQQYARICPDMQRFGNFWREVPKTAEDGFNRSPDPQILTSPGFGPQPWTKQDRGTSGLSPFPRIVVGGIKCFRLLDP